jgi:mRNA interferase MazF
LGCLLDPVRGHEQGGFRPALVISNDAFNQTPHELCVVVPITRTERGARSHIMILPPEGGLTAPSFIMCEQERSLGTTRLRRRRGRVDQATLEQAQRMVGLFIDR